MPIICKSCGFVAVSKRGLDAHQPSCQPRTLAYLEEHAKEMCSLWNFFVIDVREKRWDQERRKKELREAEVARQKMEAELREAEELKAQKEAQLQQAELKAQKEAKRQEELRLAEVAKEQFERQREELKRQQEELKRQQEELRVREAVHKAVPVVINYYAQAHIHVWDEKRAKDMVAWCRPRMAQLVDAGIVDPKGILEGLYAQAQDPGQKLLIECIYDSARIDTSVPEEARENAKALVAYVCNEMNNDFSKRPRIN